MSALIDRYWTHYGVKKRSASREKSVLDGLRSELGRMFVREVDGDAVGCWYENLTTVRGLSSGTAVRHFNEGLLAVRSKLKGGKVRYVPMPEELASELRRYPAVIGDDRIFPPKPGATSGRQRVERSFEQVLKRAAIKNFRLHDLRHTFASWYMMNGGDLYELATILGHSNIKMTERYAKLARKHIAKTGSTTREMWKLMEQGNCDKAKVG